ncbi:hypothetical protein [Phormidesmis priestleyi]
MIDVLPELQPTKRESVGKSRSTSHPDHYAPLARCSPTVKLCGGRQTRLPTDNLCTVRTNAVLGGWQLSTESTITTDNHRREIKMC